MIRNLISLLMAVSLLFAVGCSPKAKNVGDAAVTEAIPVKVRRIERSLIDRNIELVGTLYPWKEANLGAQTTGRIEKLLVEEGDAVKQGDLLFQMDDTQMAQARIQYQVAKDDFDRMEPLFNRGSISKQQFDKVKAAFETAEYAYKLLLANTQFRAPFSGVITAKKLNEGEVFLLAPGGSGAPSVVTLMQLNPLKLKSSVSEVNYQDVRLGQNADVSADAYPGEMFSGVLSKINPAINPATRTFDIEIKVSGDGKKLRPGMFVRATIHTGQVSVLAVERAAILRQAGTYAFHAFVANGNRAVRRTVRIGQEFEDRVEILDGLRGGELLVVSGHIRLKDGSPISVRQDGAGL